MLEADSSFDRLPATTSHDAGVPADGDIPAHTRKERLTRIIWVRSNHRTLLQPQPQPSVHASTLFCRADGHAHIHETAATGTLRQPESTLRLPVWCECNT